ncbi:MAG TPA: response regulator, partial [Halieaceae bacterium]|nr:response regulator [Halieaceae bacterium]
PRWPGLDGLETLRRLRANNDEVQVIVLTGQATVDKALEVIKAGALDLLQKPAPLQELITKIEEASSRRALLVEKHMEEKLKDIMGKKGW